MNTDFGTDWGMKGARTASLGERVKSLRTQRNLSQAKLGKAIGMTQTAIAEIEGGKVKRPGKLHELARELGTSPDFLLGSGEDMRSEDVAATLDGPEERKLKVMGYVGAGGQFSHFYVEDQSLETIRATNRDPAKAVAARIMGTSLGPLFDRWYVIYDDVRRPVTDDLIGKICVVWLADGRVLVKKLERGKGGFVLLSNSEAEPPLVGVDVESAARVTDIRSGQ